MPRAKVAKGPISDLLSNLTLQENKYFSKRFGEMFEQADSDPVLEPTIHSIIYNEILIARLQSEIQKYLTEGTPDMQNLDRATKVLNSLQKQNLESLDSLNLTKAKKDQLNKSPQSTPSRIISAYALAVSGMTKTERERFQDEVQEAMVRLRKNSEDLLELIPSDVAESEIDLPEN